MNLTPLSLATHEKNFFQKPNDYNYMRGISIFEALAYEMPKLCTTYTLAFQKTLEDRFKPIAILGISSDFNLYMARDGRWLAPVLPHYALNAPFVAAKSEDGRVVVCIDEDSGVFSESAENGFPLFNEEAKPSEQLQHFIDQINLQQNNIPNTIKACKLLDESNLIQPWQAVVPTKKDNIKLEGLYTIDEQKLNTLDADNLKKLQDSGALAIAYTQLISMQHLNHLGRLADAHFEIDEKYSSDAAVEDIDIDQLFADDIIKF